MVYPEDGSVISGEKEIMIKISGYLPFLLVIWALVSGCSIDSGSETATLPDVDYAYFVQRVQPILERRCAFFACHGSRERFFQVYQEARLREIPDPHPLFEAPLPLTDSELERNFRQTAGMLYGFDAPQDSPLFSKPLATGTRHAGATLFGGPDIFLDRSDPDYQTLLKWAHGARLASETGAEPTGTIQDE